MILNTIPNTMKSQMRWINQESKTKTGQLRILQINN
jgi:hypothetical protein